MASVAVRTSLPASPLIPAPFRITAYHRELSHTFSLELTPAPGQAPLPPFQPGQFNMLYHFGVGEVPISLSGDPATPHRLVHTIRRVGAVTEGLGRLRKGDVVGVRGPFGSSWPVEEAAGNDVVIVTGGIGLAPLRPAILHILANRHKYGRFVILYGARSPEEILYLKQLQTWRGRLDTYVDVTVDHAATAWAGNVGVVTRLIERARFDADHTVALVCGPEVMIRFALTALAQQGVSDDNMYVSLERNMKCATGHCGHCQLGGLFVCKDGPVFAYSQVKSMLGVRGL